MTARGNLRFTARCFYSGPDKLIENRFNETLELVGLADKADRLIKGWALPTGPGQLSRSNHRG